MKRRQMTDEQWALVAVGMAHLAFEEGDDDTHAWWVNIAGRCDTGEVTDDERAELEEAHAFMTELYDGDDEWWQLG